MCVCVQSLEEKLWKEKENWYVTGGFVVVVDGFGWLDGGEEKGENASSVETVTSRLTVLRSTYWANKADEDISHLVTNTTLFAFTSTTSLPTHYNSTLSLLELYNQTKPNHTIPYQTHSFTSFFNDFLSQPTFLISTK
jgi:hypothetical protein